VATGVPATVALTCPRCKTYRQFVNVDGGTLFRCAGCEWYWSLGTQAPTGTDTATLAVGGTSLTVASGGTAFTSGMLLLFDTTVNAEVLKVTATGTGAGGHPGLAWRRLGGPALLPWLTGVVLIVTSAATTGYGNRYLVASIPAFCIAAAIGMKEFSDWGAASGEQERHNVPTALQVQCAASHGFRRWPGRRGAGCGS